MSDYITAASLKTLAEAGTLRELELVGTPDGFKIVARLGMSEKLLRPAHAVDRPRFFKNANAALRFVRHDLKMPRCTVNVSDWLPEG